MSFLAPLQIILIFFCQLSSALESRIARLGNDLYFIRPSGEIAHFSDGNAEPKKILSLGGLPCLGIKMSVGLGRNYLCMLDAERNIWCEGSDFPLNKVPGLSEILDIHFNGKNFLFLSETKTVLEWDPLSHLIPGAMRQPFRSPLLVSKNITKLVATKSHTLALDVQGNAWGYTNSYFRVGPLRTQLQRIAVDDLATFNQICSGDKCSMLIDNNHRVWFFGWKPTSIESYDHAIEPMMIEGVEAQAIACDNGIQAALNLSGNLVIWGTLKIGTNYRRHISTPEIIPEIIGIEVMILDEEIYILSPNGTIIQYKLPSLIEEVSRCCMRTKSAAGARP